jgi:PAS domain S-box-containing protein
MMPEKPSYEELEARVRELEGVEAALRENQSLLEHSQQIADIGTFVWDLRDDSLRWSDNMFAIHGLSAETFEGNLSDVSRQLIHPDDRNYVQSEIQKMIAAKEVRPMEFRIIRADGQVRVMRSYGEFTFNDSGEPVTCIGVHQDITETRQTLMELDEWRTILRSVIDATPSCVFVKDHKGKYLVVNPAISRLYHSTPDEMIGKTDMELAQMGRLGKDEAMAFMADDREVMETKRPKTVVSEPLTADDGTTFWFYTMKKPISLPRMPDCMLGVATDITKLQEAKQAIKDAEIEKTAVLDHQPNHVVLQDLQHRILWANLSACESVGMPRDALIGKHCFEIWAGQQDPCPDCPVHQSILSGKVDAAVQTTADGRIWHIQGAPIRNQMGEIIRALEVTQDITEKAKKDQLLKESEEKVRKKLDAILSPEGDIGVLDLADILDIEAVQKMMGDFYRLTHVGVAIVDMKGKVLVATGWQDICTQFHRVHPETRKNCIESDLELSSGVEPGKFKIYRCKNNMWDIATPIVVGGKHLGNIFLGQFIFEDETPDYETFREQARRYGFDEAAYLDALDRVPRWSRETIDAVMHFYARFANLIASLSHSNLKLARTLEERNRAEADLRESEQRFRSIIESAPINILAVRNGKFVFANPAGIRLHGYETLDQMIGLDALKGVAPEFRNVIRDRIMRGNIGHENPPVEFKILKPNGQEVWFKSSSVVINFEGKPTTLILGRDISREKLADEERLRLMSAIEQAGEVIVITDPEGNIRYVNPAFEKVTGYTEREVLGKNPRILKSGRQDQAFYKELWETIASGKTWKRRLVNRRKDGTLYTEKASISPVMDPQGIITNYVAVKRDVTGEIEMEQRLAQAQKMESIGNLAGGIAHDFNNILSPIMLHAEMIMMDLPADSPLRMNMQQIYKSGDRARELVQQILTFARVKEKEKIPLKASLIVKETVKFLRATLPTTIDLSYEINTDRDTVMADPTQMHQIVMNLCTNAAQAMRDQEGELKVRLIEAHVGPEEAAELGGIAPGDFVKISVSDTGSGIAPDIMEKIFEPYFTTKEQGQGTGLGLAVIHGIVEGCEGHIAVESEMGKGSVFHVYLPIVDAHVATVQGEKSELPKGTEHILLVDDEQAALTAIQPLLERLGYRITAKTDSLEALDLFGESPEAFDIVITDQTMPHMTGKDLALELMALRPDIPIILCTGFSEQIDEHAAKRMGIRGFVPKPIVMHQMARAIREAVERRD